MSESTDQNPSDPVDDKELSALYARGSTEQPSHALDQAILDKARKTTSQQPTRTKDSSSWSQTISVAAVLVLSVTVVMLVRKEAPHPLSDTHQLAMVHEQKPEPGLATKLLPKPAKRQAEKQKEETPPVENRVAPTDLQDFLTRKKGAQKELKAQRQIRAKERKMDSAIAASPALTLKQKSHNQETLKQKEPAQETPTHESISSGKILPKNMAMGVVGSNVKEFAAEGKSCKQLTEQECFISAACTLTKNKNTSGYQCRPAKDHCELLFRQSDGTKESCETRDGCVYVPGPCYCPPGVECRCSGGEPSQCRSANK